MKVTFKLLSGVSFVLELDGSTTMGTVRDQLEKEKGYPRANTKLIFAGKVLDDNTTIAQTGVQEQNFIVVNVSKPKVAPKPAEPAPVQQPAPVQPAPQPTPAPVQQPAPVAQQPAAVVPPVSQPSPTAQQPAQAPADNALVYGEQYAGIINNFIEMGFQKEQIEKCMRAAFNNPDRAAEYLLSGIPPELEAVANAPARPPQARPAPQAQQSPVNPQQGPAATQGAGGLADVLNLGPQFNQLRAAVQSNPELLQPILQRIAQTNPQLFQIISQNPQEFIRLLNEPIPQGGFAAPQQGATNTASPQQGAQGGLGGLGNIGLNLNQPRPQQPSIFISPQEKEAIDRLVALGFDPIAATQAYFAFDKNENLAANFLLEGGGFEEDFDDGEEGDDPSQGNQ